MNEHDRSVLFSVESERKKDYGTPNDLFDFLNKIYKFTLDPCAKRGHELCEKNYYEEDDGLSKSWKDESVYLNPPYGKILDIWFEKIQEEYEKNNTLMVALIPARTDRIMFHEIILPKASEIWFVKGRIKFKEDDGTEAKDPAGFPSMIVIFDKRNRTVDKFKSLIKKDGKYFVKKHKNF